ncbi:MAG: exodeoxyribonuclease V subunit gamma, partial [Pseudomonadota bacterium]
LPGMARPGDRSRRDDDRYLMLEAVLAARDRLYISWVGRNVRDNSEQPASVLVSQLRDYLAAGWQLDLAALTTEHALQPFSRKYFEAGGLLTYAGEWRAAHAGDDPAEAGAATPAAPDRLGLAALPPYEVEPQFRLTLRELASFVRQPVRYFFRRRLSVSFSAAAALGEDEEPFALNALERYLLEDILLDDSGQAEALSEVRASLDARAARLAREGVLPIGLLGQHWRRQLVDALVPVRRAWLALCARYPLPADKLALTMQFGALRLDDWLDRLRGDGDATVWLMQISSKVLGQDGQARADKLIGMWLRQLAAAAHDYRLTGYLVARDAVVSMRPLDPAAARLALAAVVALWREGMDRPLPTACKSALALAQDGDPRAVYDGGFELAGERDDLCLARLWPDYAALSAEPAWLDCSLELYGPLAEWIGNDITLTPIEAADGAGAPAFDDGAVA